MLLLLLVKSHLHLLLIHSICVYLDLLLLLTLTLSTVILLLLLLLVMWHALKNKSSFSLLSRSLLSCTWLHLLVLLLNHLISELDASTVWVLLILVIEILLCCLLILYHIHTLTTVWRLILTLSIRSRLWVTTLSRNLVVKSDILRWFYLVNAGVKFLLIIKTHIVIHHILMLWDDICEVTLIILDNPYSFNLFNLNSVSAYILVRRKLAHSNTSWHVLGNLSVLKGNYLSCHMSLLVLLNSLRSQLRFSFSHLLMLAAKLINSFFLISWCQ